MKKTTRLLMAAAGSCLSFPALAFFGPWDFAESRDPLTDAQIFLAEQRADQLAFRIHCEQHRNKVQLIPSGWIPYEKTLNVFWRVDAGMPRVESIDLVGNKLVFSETEARQLLADLFKGKSVSCEWRPAMVTSTAGSR